MTKAEYRLFVANEIMRQIRAGDPYAMMAWGATNTVALDEKKLDHGYQLGGLQFKVNGMKHKGLVLVRLMGNDTYTVETVKMRKGEFSRVNLIEGVYCDNIMQVIDSEIER